MRHFRWRAAAAILAAATLGVVPPASARAADTAAAPARVTVKFAPPLGRVLRFQISTQRYKDGKPTMPRPAVWVEELRYEKADQGFTLYWRMDPASLPPEMRSPMMAPMIKPFTGDPVAFDVDATGRIVRARDWPATRAAMETTVKDLRPLLMAEPGGTAAIADKVTAFLIARFDQVTAEGAPDVIMQNIVPIFSWSDFSMAIGESREAAVQMPIAMFDTSVNVRAKVTLLGSDGQSVRLLDHESVDPAELQRVMKVLAARIDASKKPPAIDETALDLVGTINLTVDIPTGIVSRFDMENRQGEDGPLVQKRVITWLRQAPAS